LTDRFDFANEIKGARGRDCGKCGFVISEFIV